MDQGKFLCTGTRQSVEYRYKKLLSTSTRQIVEHRGISGNGHKASVCKCVIRQVFSTVMQVLSKVVEYKC